MLLSEAIRLGSLLGPQIYGFPFGPNDGSCALGAACIAMGLARETGSIPVKLKECFPGLQARYVRGVPLSAIIIHMNDVQHMKREEIADRLVAAGMDCESVIEVNQPIEEAICV